MTTAAYAAVLMLAVTSLVLLAVTVESIVDTIFRLLNWSGGGCMARIRRRADEYDLWSTFGRRYLGWQRGERKRIRRRVAKRERQEAMAAIRHDPESA